MKNNDYYNKYKYKSPQTQIRIFLNYLPAKKKKKINQ